MTELLANFTQVMTFVIAQLQNVINTVLDTPVLLFFVALGVGVMLINWVRSLIHV